MFYIVYTRNEKNDLKYFENQIFFLFSDRRFYADQKSFGCLFSILSIFRVKKFFVILLNKKFFPKTELRYSYSFIFIYLLMA